MAEPKKRLTSTRSGNRQSHRALKTLNLGNCPKCQEPVIPHQVCLNCGTYRGQQVIKLKEEKQKRK